MGRVIAGTGAPDYCDTGLKTPTFTSEQPPITSFIRANLKIFPGEPYARAAGVDKF